MLTKHEIARTLRDAASGRGAFSPCRALLLDTPPAATGNLDTIHDYRVAVATARLLREYADRLEGDCKATYTTLDLLVLALDTHEICVGLRRDLRTVSGWRSDEHLCAREALASEFRDMAREAHRRGKDGNPTT